MWFFLLPQRRDLLFLLQGLRLCLIGCIVFLLPETKPAHEIANGVRVKSSGHVLALQSEKITTMNELCMDELMYGWLKGSCKVDRNFDFNRVIKAYWISFSSIVISRNIFKGITVCWDLNAPTGITVEVEIWASRCIIEGSHEMFSFSRTMIMLSH